MKRVLLLVTGLLAGAGTALAQRMELPIEEVWRYEFHQVGPAIGSTWIEDGSCHVLLKEGNRAFIISDGEVIWEVDSLSGNIGKAKRVIFNDGPAILLLYKSRGDVIVLKLDGDNYETRTSYLYARDASNVDEDNYYDAIDLEIFNDQSDQGNDAGIYMSYRNTWHTYGPNGDDTNGSAYYIHLYNFNNQYSPGDSKIVRTTPKMLAFRDANAVTSYMVLGAQSGSFLSTYSPDLELLATDATGTGAICPIIDNDNSVQLAGIHLIDGTIYFIIHTIPQLNVVYRLRLGNIGTVYTMTTFKNRNNEFGHSYLLAFSYEGLVGVIDLDERSFLGLIYQFHQGIYWANFDNYDQDDDLELAVLSSEAFIVYDIEPLTAAFSNSTFHPSSLILSAFPNPFNSSTTINYSLPTPGRYAIDVVDIQGRLVSRLSDGWKEAGSYRSIWNAPDNASGHYILRLNDGRSVQSVPVVLVK